MPSHNRIITVIGATGNQGSGVVSALFSSTAFSVRAVSRDPSSKAAKALLDKHADAVKEGRFEVVAGELSDQNSLEKALEGAYGSFGAWTSYSDEYAEVKRLVDAAKAAGIAHFVYSSLPSITEASGGKLTKVKLFDNKAKVTSYAKEQLPAATAVVPGSFLSNLYKPIYTRRGDDGTAIFCEPIKEATTLEFVDESYDVGVTVAAILTKGPSLTASKTYFIGGPPTTTPELAAEYAELTGEKTLIRPLSREEALSIYPLPEEVVEEYSQMYEYLDTVDPSKRMYGTVEPEEVQTEEELGVRASTLKEWLDRTGFRVGASAE
ncbi:hypothetical protein JCM8097_007433 [Rhodosporidiobolus ruineniae]